MKLNRTTLFILITTSLSTICVNSAQLGKSVEYFQNTYQEISQDSAKPAFSNIVHRAYVYEKNLRLSVYFENDKAKAVILHKPDWSKLAVDDYSELLRVNQEDARWNVRRGKKVWHRSDGLAKAVQSTSSNIFFMSIIDVNFDYPEESIFSELKEIGVKP